MILSAKSFLFRLGAVVMAVATGYPPMAKADDFASQRQTVEILSTLTKAPGMQLAEGYESSGTQKAIYYDALDWKGKPTKVFAWLGMPANASEHNQVPAIVLVHGGGGTAFKQWVQKWNAKGYAAISIAVEGQTDKRGEGNAPAIATGWKKHQWSGPERKGIYNDASADVPIIDQWMYHAVADTILANSLLRSLPEVDAPKIGLMGISWGGVITSTVIGIDHRFAFAIPTYGCGDLSTTGNQYGRSLGNNDTYKQVWDPMLRLKKTTMPTQWFSWPEDKHFPMNHFAACYGEVTGSHMVTLIPKMRHGHGPPWTKPDSYAFADSVVKNGKPWGNQTSATLKGGKFTVGVTSSKSLVKAVLVSTTDNGVTGSRKWEESAAALKGMAGSYTASATLPKATTAWFINMVTAEGLIVSSDYQHKR